MVYRYRGGEPLLLMPTDRLAEPTPPRSRRSVAAVERPPASPETRARLSAAMKARWADPAAREKLVEGLRRRHADPEYRAANTERLRALAKEVNARRGPHTAESRERIAEGMRRRWADPEYRAKVSASRRGARLSEATREKIRRAQHVRHHAARGITKPGCPFCEEATP